MKKTMVFLTLSLAVLVFPMTAMAAVSGECSNCHTMHNSQGAETVVLTSTGETTPQSALLVSDCLGCHTTDGGEPYDNVEGYPYVMDNADAFTDGRCLAGGFFDPTTAWVSNDNNSDNNHTLGSTFLPAGYADDESLGDWYTGDTGGGGNGLGCAGDNGCHGIHNVTDDMEAISGGHHATDPTIYRILYVGNNLAGDGVAGTGASDYEELLIQSEGDGSPHNIYSADRDADNTISELCAICHGNFHNETGTTDDTGSAATSWIRHPSDEPIPVDWLIGDTGNPLLGVDYKNNPVGFAGGTSETGERKVTCLSCHRAHGTDNLDLLRWAYSTQEAGSTTVTYGCLGCHDKQRG